LARELPGLGRTWIRLHRGGALDQPTFPALCARIARALADLTYVDPHPLVIKARTMFAAQSLTKLSWEACRQLGSRLGNDVGQTRLPFDARDYSVEPPYRDDHQWLWEPLRDANEVETLEETQLDEKLAPQSPATQARDKPAPQVSLAKVVSTARAGQHEGPPSREATLDATVRYPEWDYRIGSSRPAFATIREQARPPMAADAYAHEVSLDRAGALRFETWRKRHRQVEGDALDLDAAIEAAIDLRLRRAPSPHVYLRRARQPQTLAVLTLLDLSQSMADLVPGGTASILAKTREASLRLGQLLERTNHRFALHGFSSDGRHAVEYHRFKDLDAVWDRASQVQLRAVQPRLSTRMGAALRHAGRLLRDARQQQRLILLLTDGEPSDIDAPDPRYLREDARHAVHELEQAGVHVFAIGLDPEADRYMQRIFGLGRYCVLTQLEKLPELLPRLYARIAG
jgi:nitric oxide reductase NorD protein